MYLLQRIFRKKSNGIAKSLNDFWFKIEHFILTSIHYVIDINRESAIFLNGNLKKLNLENYILLPTRYSIYNCRIQNKMPLLSTWKILIR